MNEFDKSFNELTEREAHLRALRQLSEAKATKARAVQHNEKKKLFTIGQEPSQFFTEDANFISGFVEHMASKSMPGAEIIIGSSAQLVTRGLRNIFMRRARSEIEPSTVIQGYHIGYTRKSFRGGQPDRQWSYDAEVFLCDDKKLRLREHILPESENSVLHSQGMYTGEFCEGTESVESHNGWHDRRFTYFAEAPLKDVLLNIAKQNNQ